MKKINIIFFSLIVFGGLLSSCFQDLEQNPPFDYPEEPEKPTAREDGLMFQLTFDDTLTDEIGLNEATKVGSPTFATGKTGKAYAGAADSYLTFRLSDLVEELGTELTVGFWYKVNAAPGKAGILVIGPPDEAAPDAPNNRKSGIRIFREGSAAAQTIKGNIGNGTADTWLDGGDAAVINPEAGAWKYITLTLTTGSAKFYIDAVEVKSATTTVSWANCDIISIGSGAPRFTGWEHFWDGSLIDDLRFYNRALPVQEIQEIIAGE